MYTEHQFAFDPVFGRAYPFCVFDHSHAVSGVDKVGTVGTLLFQEFSGCVALGRDQHELHLFAETGDKACALHQLQLVGPAVLLSGVVAAGLLGTVLIFAHLGS